MFVTLVIGLPGSGKTTLAQKICAETGAVLIDDPRDLILNNEGRVHAFKTVLTRAFKVKKSGCWNASA